MRFTLLDLDISLNVSVSSLLYDTKATTTIQLDDLMAFLRGNVNKYSSVVKPLNAFDCGGFTIMDDWVKHVSVYEHNLVNYPYTNTQVVSNQLQLDYMSKLLLKTSSIPAIRKYLYNELYTNRRCCFKSGDVLLYRTIISPYIASSVPSKRYLMQVIINA